MSFWENTTNLNCYLILSRNPDRQDCQASSVKMATPPVISAPTLVTSTNLAATPPHSHQAREEDNFWHSKYLEAKVNYRKLKSQMREQAKKSRLLIVAVKNILEQEELKMAKVC